MIDPLILSRIQFAANISFHILFPTISIALGWYLCFFAWRAYRTKQSVWSSLYLFWVKIFALTFALGVVSGITMSFQFGTNWPGYMQVAGNVAGPLLAYEILTAFFLEATFLGVMLFGRQRVSPRMHLIASFLVAFGTSVSAFWILSLNSWMQTPAGVVLVDGKVQVQDWFAVIFNPSMPYRLSHMLVASGLTASFLIAGISAWKLRRFQNSEVAKTGFRTAVKVAAVLIPLQIFIGDMHGLNTREHQPAKLAAIEAVWHTEKGAALTLFGLPNEETKQTDYAVTVPKLASLILTHDINGEIRGLNEFSDHPPVAKVFWSFRVMVGMGLLMLLVAWGGAWYLLKQQTIPQPVLRIFSWMTFSGWFATLAGWFVTEIGRQPWLVTGILRTADAVTKVGSHMVLSSLVMYLVLYVVLLSAYVSVVFHLAGKAGKQEV
ncbi:cytochrome ubiquinol oxidase subunit I [Leeia sp. TBRC 13508]|uniref:Cytochrome ubiquinol oxidase subunit I n=1 Tax=Leeia speluncae TaxID=2884804 RepID=A0ABS8D825_9NEIS|nr:cytochrome ubiquinol oxidase subunit I [Leeia speluncae]MCB6184326.1 cytochrome ubiquinol oxidase subunit I [Leeia speluncae]